MFSSEATTHGITVSVESRFLPSQSDRLLRSRIGLECRSQGYLFAYRIRISNDSPETVQLLSRYWRIVDAKGHVEEVRGPGVVGKQPVLEAGASFEYTSYCPLTTPFGTMEGAYRMATTDGGRFDAEIARFELSLPLQVN